MNKKIFVILLVSFYIPTIAIVVTAFMKIQKLEENIVGLEKKFIAMEKKKQSSSPSKEKENETGDETLNILMTFAKIHKQMDNLSKEIEDLKKLRKSEKKEDATYKEISRHQEDLWRRFSSSYRSFYTKGKKQLLEQQGFQDYEQDLIIENFEVIMKDIESAQILWMNGKIDMEELMLRIQDAGRELQNHLSGDIGEEKARKALRTMIDNPVYQQLLFPPGSE